MALAAGDVFADIAEVAAGAFLDVVPATDYEAEVSAITVHAGGKVEIYHSDGTLSAKVNTVNAPDGAIIPLVGDEGKGFGVNEGHYLRVKNVGAAALVVGYSGNYVKVPA